MPLAQRVGEALLLDENEELPLPLNVALPHEEGERLKVEVPEDVAHGQVLGLLVKDAEPVTDAVRVGLKEGVWDTLDVADSDGVGEGIAVMEEDTLGEGEGEWVREGLVDIVGVPLRVLATERVPDTDPDKDVVKLADPDTLPVDDTVDVEVGVAGLVEGRELGDTVEVTHTVKLVEGQGEEDGDPDTEEEGVSVPVAVREVDVEMVGVALSETLAEEESDGLGHGVEE